MFLKKKNQLEEVDIKKSDLSVFVRMIFYVITTLLTVTTLVPLILTVVVSFTENETLMLEGYKLWPSKWSTSAYEYLFKSGTDIWQAYGVTIFITVVGTVIGIIFMSLFA